MPRYGDKWLIDKTLFEYTTGGSCACCSFPANLFGPNGLKGLINSVSDLETDAANDEFKAAQNSPWPPEMRDQIWADRVKLRLKMKREMRSYRSFLESVANSGTEPQMADMDRNSVGSNSSSVGVDRLKRWCIESLGANQLRRLFQMPRSQVTEKLDAHYNIHSIFKTVIGCVVDQVAYFKLTKLDADGRGEVELRFEKILSYDRRGGFVLNLARKKQKQKGEGGQIEEELVVDEEVLDGFLAMFASLGGPKLLQRGPSTSKNEYDPDEEGDVDAGDDVVTDGQKGPSFRSDRRVVRLMIARYWADQLMSKYNAMEKEKSLTLGEKDDGDIVNEISKRVENSVI